MKTEDDVQVFLKAQRARMEAEARKAIPYERMVFLLLGTVSRNALIACLRNQDLVRYRTLRENTRKTEVHNYKARA